MTPSILQQLAGILCREREVLDLLIAKLVEDADPADRDPLLRSISSLELHRAIMSREVALELGLQGEPTLQDLVERAPREWAATLEAHGRALVDAATEVRALGRQVLTEIPVGSNIVALPVPGPRLIQRSLLEFLDEPV